MVAGAPDNQCPNPAPSLRQTQLTEVVADAFAFVFELDWVKADASFFEMGGDSLLAELLATEITTRTGIEFPVTELLENESPTQIGNWLSKAELYASSSSEVDRNLPRAAAQNSHIRDQPENLTHDSAPREAFDPIAFPSEREPIPGYLWRAPLRVFYKTILPNLPRVNSGVTKPAQRIIRSINYFNRNAWVRNGRPGILHQGNVTILGLNVRGTNAPLFWIANGHVAPVNLAKAIGPGQPIYALRSLRKLLGDGMTKSALTAELAKIYAKELITFYPRKKYLIGGYCDGGRIAVALARELARRGRHVSCLFLAEYAPEEPYDGRLSLFFGKNSNGKAAARWAYSNNASASARANLSLDLVPGNHADMLYFPTIMAFSETLRERIAQTNSQH